MGQGEQEDYEVPHSLAALLRLFDSPLGHVLLFFLLVIDVSTVAASGFLDAHFLVSQIDDCKAYVSACASHHRRLDDLQQGNDGGEVEAANAAALPRFLASSSSSSGGGSSNSTQCSGHPHFGNHSMHDAEKILAYVSMGILTIFLMEQLLRIVASRCKYFKSPLHVLDFIVVALSLALEIIVTHLPLSGMLILARIWRFGRTSYTTFEGLHDMHKVRPALDSLGQHALEAVWGRLQPARWNELARQNVGTLSLEHDEAKLALEIAQASPAFVLNALALENERLRDAGLSIRNLHSLANRGADKGH